jgi:hypothetical protein
MNYEQYEQYEQPTVVPVGDAEEVILGIALLGLDIDGTAIVGDFAYLEDDVQS